MLVSVIIPTYNREKVLCNTLESVFEQQYDSFEIVVVDQTLEHKSETEAFFLEYTERFRLLRIGTPGLPNARNEGIKVANGEVILFCDDDVILKPNWITYHVENYRNSAVGAVGGRILERGKPISENTPNRGYINVWGRPVGNFTSMHRSSIKTVRGGNMSFRRTVLEKVGVFDVNFIGTAIMEESDLCYRILRAGYKVVYEPRAELLHLPQPSGNAETRRAFRSQWYRDYFHNGILFNLKNKPRWELMPFLSAQLLIAVKHGVFAEKDIHKFMYIVAGLRHGFKMFIEGSY